MTARKPRPTLTAAVQPDPAAEFDVEGWITGFKPMLVKAKMFRRADLIPRIIELQAEAVKLAPKEDDGVDDSAGYVAVVEEHNRLAETLEASAEVFEFLPMDADMVKSASEKADADGVPEDDKQARGTYLIAETCVSHPWLTGKHLAMLRKQLGDAALNSLGEAFNEAQQLGGMVEADFLPLPLRAQNTDE
jgi:hypothetical protein